MARQKGFTDEVILEAVARHGGVASRAAREIDSSLPNVIHRLKRLGVSVGKNNEAHRRTATEARVRLDEVRRGVTMAARSSAPERVTVAARCHPDRQEFQMGLCRDCYRERRERSLATPLPSREIDPDVKAQLEGLARAGSAEKLPLLLEDGHHAPRPPRYSPPKLSRAVRAIHAGEPLDQSEFQLLEAMLDGASVDVVARRTDLGRGAINHKLESIQAKTGAKTLVGVYRAIGWLKPDYEETMTQSFLSLLERLDGAIHEAMTAARRGRE